MRLARLVICLTTVSCCSLLPALTAEPIPVRYVQGSSHGFAALKTLDGVTLATGESTQTVRRGKVTSRLTFRFKDGSVDDDVTVFTQQAVFRLVSDHHIQHGPSFPKPIDFLIEMASGDLTFEAETAQSRKSTWICLLMCPTVSRRISC